jgi:tRNA 2-thiouridine synthesizing protein A
MPEKTLDLRGLKCPLPALRTRKALTTLKSGDLLVVECTDPLTAIDIPNLLNQTGDKLEGQSKEKKVLIFRIRKR